jgi:hypothetical protein
MPIIIDQFEFDALDDDLKALLGASDQSRTEEQMVREIILNAIDPIIALGEPFRFERREPDDFYISIDVAAPWAQVDLAIAWEVAQQDAKACQLTLQHDHSLEATLRVYVNTIKWLRFWCVRLPNAEWRERFERKLQAREEGLNRLREKAKWRFELEIVGALANV